MATMFSLLETPRGQSTAWLENEKKDEYAKIHQH